MNNIAVVVMVYLVVPTLIITFLEGCFSAVPKEFHAIRNKYVWFLFAPVGLRLLNGIFAPLTNVLVWSTIDTAISSADVPLRFFIFLGLVRTFSIYFTAKDGEPDVPVPNRKETRRGLVGGKIAVWLLVLFNVAVFAGEIGAVCWMATHTFTNPDKDRPIWVQLFTDGPPLLGSIHALLLILFLATMNGLKGAVVACERRGRQTALRKRIAPNT